MKKQKFTGSTCGELADWLDAPVDSTRLTEHSKKLRELASHGIEALRLSEDAPWKRWRNIIRTYKSATALPVLELKLSGADVIRRHRRIHGRITVTRNQKDVLAKLGKRVEMFDGIPCIVAKPGEGAR